VLISLAARCRLSAGASNWRASERRSEMQRNHYYSLGFALTLSSAGVTLCCFPVAPPTPPWPDVSPSAGAGGVGPVVPGPVSGAGGEAPVVTTTPTFPGCTPYAEPGLMAATGLEWDRKFGAPTVPRTNRVTAAVDMPGGRVTGRSVWHQPKVAEPLNQRGTSACTGYAMSHNLGTFPFSIGSSDAQALQYYGAATRLDRGCGVLEVDCPGAYPAVDEGSWSTSVLAAVQVLRVIPGGRDVDQTVQGWHDALVSGPCSFDQNWYAYTTDTCGHVTLEGPRRGGHATSCVGFDVESQRMWCRNSWGKWGIVGGYYYYTVEDLKRLHSEGAVMVCPRLLP
jgi:hypothetical protein